MKQLVYGIANLVQRLFQAQESQPMAEWFERWSLNENYDRVAKEFRRLGCQIQLIDIDEKVTRYWVIIPTPRKKKKQQNDNNPE